MGGPLLDWLTTNVPKFGELLGAAFNSVESLFLTTGAEGAVELSFFGQVLGLGIIAALVTFGVRTIIKAINGVKVRV